VREEGFGVGGGEEAQKLEGEEAEGGRKGEREGGIRVMADSAPGEGAGGGGGGGRMEGGRGCGRGTGRGGGEGGGRVGRVPSLGPSRKVVCAVIKASPDRGGRASCGSFLWSHALGRWRGREGEREGGREGGRGARVRVLAAPLHFNGRNQRTDALEGGRGGRRARRKEGREGGREGGAFLTEG